MSREAARIEIYGMVRAAAAAWIAWPVIIDFENRPSVDFTAQPKPYLAVDIVYYDGKQVDMADNPYVGRYGNILLAAMTPVGRGTSESNLLIDHFSKYLQMKGMPLISTKAARPLPPVEPLGWYGTMASVDFWYYELSQ